MLRKSDRCGAKLSNDEVPMLERQIYRRWEGMMLAQRRFHLADADVGGIRRSQIRRPQGLQRRKRGDAMWKEPECRRYTVSEILNPDGWLDCKYMLVLVDGWAPQIGLLKSTCVEWTGSASISPEPLKISEWAPELQGSLPTCVKAKIEKYPIDLFKISMRKTLYRSSIKETRLMYKYNVRKFRNSPCLFSPTPMFASHINTPLTSAPRLSRNRNVL
jgi:hypothetical protein